MKSKKDKEADVIKFEKNIYYFLTVHLYQIFNYRSYHIRS
jgi:hypothetical protein